MITYIKLHLLIKKLNTLKKFDITKLDGHLFKLLAQHLVAYAEQKYNIYQSNEKEILQLHAPLPRITKRHIKLYEINIKLRNSKQYFKEIEEKKSTDNVIFLDNYRYYK